MVCVFFRIDLTSANLKPKPLAEGRQLNCWGKRVCRFGGNSGCHNHPSKPEKQLGPHSVVRPLDVAAAAPSKAAPSPPPWGFLLPRARPERITRTANPGRPRMRWGAPFPPPPHFPASEMAHGNTPGPSSCLGFVCLFTCLEVSRAPCLWVGHAVSP